MNYVAMFNIAAAYERFNKFSCAFKWFKRVIQTDPTFSTAYMGAALNLFKQGKFKLSAAYIEESIVVLEEEKVAKLGGRIDTAERED